MKIIPSLYNPDPTFYPQPILQIKNTLDEPIGGIRYEEYKRWLLCREKWKYLRKLKRDALWSN